MLKKLLCLILKSCEMKMKIVESNYILPLQIIFSGWFIENVGLRNAIRKKGEELGEDGLEYLKQVDARMRNEYEQRREKRREKKRLQREEMQRQLEAEQQQQVLPLVVPDQNHAVGAVV